MIKEISFKSAKIEWSNGLATLVLHLFGHPVVELDGQPVVFETRKALGILIYLNRSRGESRGMEAKVQAFSLTIFQLFI